MFIFIYTQVYPIIFFFQIAPLYKALLLPYYVDIASTLLILGFEKKSINVSAQYLEFPLLV